MVARLLRTRAIVTEDAAAWACPGERMGLPALAGAPGRPENRRGNGMTDLLDRISALLGASTRDLDQIERTLTDGYAVALSLEAERWRLEKRVTGLSQEIERGDTARKTHELADVARRLKANGGDLAKLRDALSELRRHADNVRVGSPAS